MCYRFEEWTVSAMEWPRVWRHCAGCRTHAPFVCSEKFRTNANKKLLDVWLIYRCGLCEAIWNYPIVARSNVKRMDARLREAFAANDNALARRHAFDLTGLRGYSVNVETSERVCVTRKTVTVDGRALQGDTLHVRLRDPCALRADRFLANELKLSRNELQRRFEAGRLHFTPARNSGLRQALIDDLRVCFIASNVLPRA